jgi:hypothetical protein
VLHVCLRERELLVQARDDGFVPFQAGKALYDSLTYLSEGSLKKPTSSENSHPSEVQSSELVLIGGGHCTGFIKAPSLMPAAVCTALDRLRAKHAM